MKTLEFKTAFKYSFNRPLGMLNGLWLLLPVLGWLVILGYVVRIIKEFIKGNFKKLPTLKFGDDLKLGAIMFIKSVPFIVVCIVIMAIADNTYPIVLICIEFVLGFFIMPILFIHFCNKETAESLFDFKIIKIIFINLEDYIMTMLKSILLSVIFLIMAVFLVGIPAGMFTRRIFIADFYRRNVK